MRTLAILNLMLVLVSGYADAQTYIIVAPSDSVRRFLASEWDATADERAYCGTFTVGIASDGEPLLLLNAVNRANETEATPVSVSFSCPRGMAPIHSHPNYVCGPSMKDLRHLRRTNALFGIALCGPYSYAGFSSKLIWPKP